MKATLKFILTAILGASLALQAQEHYIDINGKATHLIPVSITGFSGEADSVLKFDLSVLGIVVQDPPEFVITGKGEGRVEGSLSQGGRNIFVRAYNGGSVRAQTHALANDIAKELRNSAPIFQTRIAFRLSHGSSSEVCVSDYDGYNPFVLTHDGTLVESPSWVPGGRALLYTSWMNGSTAIYEHNLSTGSRRAFANYPGSSFSAEASPDGQRVAMILSKGGSPNLYVADISGGDLKQLTRTRDEDSSPCWSPDSREICFVCRSGKPRLEKISIDGGAPTIMRVTGGVYGDITAPDWSPDGKWIAFTSGSRPFHIWVVPAEGGDAKSLADGEDPCWAPNSRTLIFTQEMNEKHVLSLLDVPTKHVKTIRQISGSCSEPSWAR